ncbi:hypothetical protein [Xenorhabdus hominickii]|uniref:Uncharacterized protein n=1 Tax=Xenorhabdus hominickii TaxID=351679 RepID=A0A1V0M472_XENHO|nr:hypothetical protein [Xenorhabdus hominickii]ARD69662.1 hypothetical protein [Xenorhabdus hominickii]PHM52376.1 hypothetical protein Xhom_04454 [Xenorhabdus hominickii]
MLNQRNIKPIFMYYEPELAALIQKNLEEKTESVMNRYKHAVPGESIEFRNLGKNNEWKQAIFVCHTISGFVLEYEGVEALFYSKTTELRPCLSTESHKIQYLEKELYVISQNLFSHLRSNNFNEHTEQMFFSMMKQTFEQTYSGGKRP